MYFKSLVFTLTALVICAVIEPRDAVSLIYLSFDLLILLILKTVAVSRCREEAGEEGACALCEPDWRIGR